MNKFMGVDFEKEVCCICYDTLHEGHHGWDICAECRKYEVGMCIEQEKDSGDPNEYTCECYAGVV